MNILKKIFLMTMALSICLNSQLFSAIGCTLTNPAQDLKFLFPEVTSFREEVREFRMMPEGEAMYKALKTKLGGDLDPVYESFDTPFTIYKVFKGSDLIGIVHGVNIPGRGGVIQVFLSTDPVTGKIRQFFFQRLESQIANNLRQKSFRNKFSEISLADFYMHDYFKIKDPDNKNDKIGAIASPLKPEQNSQDYLATLRGIRKNLILLDYFVYNNMHVDFYTRAQALLKK